MQESKPDFLEAICRVMARQPEKCAIRCGDASVSFGELDRRSASIARGICSMGVRPNSLIGVMIERSPDLLVTLIGVLRSGNAFVPIDPRFPQERIDYMVSHSQAPLVIVDPDRETSGKGGASFRSFRSIEQSADDSVRTPSIDPGSGAYVIYTSGSTGIPKGVVVNRPALSNFLYSMAEKPGMSDSDVLLAITTISFDIAYLELFLPLIVGGTVVIATSEEASDGSLLQALLDEHKPSVMQGTPATWQMLFAAGWSGLSGLKVLCGGEAAPAGLFTRLIDATAECWNMYGPTETTIWSSCYRVKDENSPVLIGSPINETVFFVLDDNGKPVATGQQGELLIGGAGLAEGYLHDPEMTETRFTSRPEIWEGRLYRTGDVVTFTDNDTIAFVGRNDQQVKLRGYRIELGDVESAIEAHPQIETAAARLLEEGEDKILAAFVATSGSDVPSLAELRKVVLEILPEYMVPQRFLLVEEMPLTPNRKVDRRALDSLQGTQVIGSGAGSSLPNTDIEMGVHEIWCELLGLSSIGADEDFFHVGGHSLIATRMWARIKSRFKVDIPLRAVFDETTIRKLAARISEISESAGADIGIPQVSRLQAPVMSVTQQRFWYIDQLTEQSPLFNLCAAFRFTGPLGVESLGQALNSLISRHEILRTRLSWEGELPLQIIEPALTFKLPLEDLSETPEAERLQVLLEKVDVRVQRKVPIDKAPALDACLYRLGETDHVLFFMPHHVIWDGWSFDIFLAELKAFYESIEAGTEPDLPELSIQYADYSVWHRQRVDGHVLDDQIEYWQNVLGDELPVLDLPTDSPRPSEFSFDGDVEYLQFDEEVIEAITSVARANSTTVNVVVLALYFGLLHRYTGQDDIIIGSPIQGRLVQETEDLIGVFVNTLPIRANVSGNPTVTELVRRIRDVALEAYQHQEVPFERLVELFGQTADFSRPPVFQTLFTFQEVSGRDDQFGDTALSQINIHNGTCPSEISFWLKSSPDALHGAVEYNTSLFSRARISRLVKHLIRFFGQAAMNPETRLSDVDYIESAERRTLVHSINDTGRPGYESLGNLLARPLDSHADKAALIVQEEVITYRELHARADALSRLIRSKGIDGNAVVAICLERDSCLISALLGCIKAGLAYLPLDPNNPPSRNKRVLEKAGASLLIATTRTANELANDDCARTLLLDEIDLSAPVTSSKYEGESESDDDKTLAYVIFTSGSTGEPKGVEVPRSSVANFLTSMMRVPGIGETDVVLGLTSVTFDIHVLEIFGALGAGATLVLLDEADCRDGFSIATALRERDITLMQATPSTWQLLESAGWDGDPGLKALVGGEALSPELSATLTGKVGELWNMYGPTETTVWSTCSQLGPGDEAHIGKPIDNTQVYVLDSYQQLTGLGVCGELYICGDGLAFGYRGDTDQTDYRFVNIDIDGPTRAYRTGDVVYVGESGNLHFVGRKDDQVKVRGHRIELGEIESALAGVDGIERAAARVISTSSADARIVAYYITESSVTVAGPKIRKHLRRVLPDYMMPQHLISLESFPVNSSGKLNRKALPDPTGSGAAGDIGEKPATDSEKKIADLWQALIGLDQVGRNDRFFEIGGHSLLSMKFITELRKETGIELRVRDVVLLDLRELAEKMGGSSAEEARKERSTLSKYR